MHVVTFYSFKGGVGRTMALVNVAAELAKSGRRVLIVDFDLEAPGLRSFNFEKKSADCPGIVEYVSTYINTQTSPDAREYIYEAHRFPETNGSIWVMPAGIQDETYEQRFSSINWETLYAEKDGYLLMEDLRNQWEETIHPDYVLIDSRTGFTDVSGICTRQLPNAVCLIFTPNPQNLFGLEQVCAGIEKQRKISGLRHPSIHFVASNVPNLDDENEVLLRTLKKFSATLKYGKLTSTIYHYNSLALVEQDIFVLNHPNSQLAKQYGHLAKEIAKSNPEDKQSAIAFLQSVAKDYPEGREDLQVKDVDRRIEEILSCLGQDNDVLFWLSRVYRSAGRWDASRLILEQVISDGYSDPRARLDLARIKIHSSNNENDTAAADLFVVLNKNEHVRVTEVLFAIQLLMESDNIDIRAISSANSLSFLSADDITYICSALNKSEKALRISKDIINEALETRDLDIEDRTSLLSALGITLIGLGELQDSIKIYQKMDLHASTEDIVDAFNYAMAMYWTGNSAYEAFFKRTIGLFDSIDDIFDLNNLQCLAFANWAVGHKDESSKLMSKARAVARTKFHAFLFSCWRYRQVSQSDFISDLDEMDKMFAGENRAPKFLRLQKTLH